MDEIRMSYRKYKQAYSDCKTVPGSYDAGAKTILVLIPEGRMKKSGVRGEKFKYMRFTGTDTETGKNVSVIIKAINVDTATRQLQKNYAKSIIWNL